MANYTIYSPMNTACCPVPTIVITEGCESFVNLDTAAAVTIWNGLNEYVALSVYIDEYTLGATDTGTGGGATVTVTANGTTTDYLVQSGSTIIIVDRKVTNVAIQSITPANPLTGRLCYRIYETINL